MRREDANGRCQAPAQFAVAGVGEAWRCRGLAAPARAPEPPALAKASEARKAKLKEAITEAEMQKYRDDEYKGIYFSGK